MTNKLEMKIVCDTTSIDEAQAKAEKLVETLEKANLLESKLADGRR